MAELYLVTGAGGFVGGHLVEHLRSKGLAVRAMIHSGMASPELIQSGAEIVSADITKPDQLKDVCSDVTGVFHIAALFRKAGLHDSVYYQVNAEGTRNIFDAAITRGVKRIIHCSTIGVLSHIANPPGNEETEPNPADIYQSTKLAGEQIALDYFRKHKIKGVVIRPAMIYGPGDMRTLKLFKMVAKRRFFYVGSGEQHVHFIDVRDLVEAFSLAMQKTELTGEVYIIAGQEPVSLKTIVNFLADELEVPHPWLHLPVVPMQFLGDICEAVCKVIKVNPPLYRRRVDFFTKNRAFTNIKAVKQLGFKPRQHWKDEVRDIIRWYKQHDFI